MKKSVKFLAATLFIALCAFSFAACFGSGDETGEDPNNMTVTFYTGDEVYKEYTGLKEDGYCFVPENPADSDGKQFVGWFRTQEDADTFSAKVEAGGNINDGVFLDPLFINDDDMKDGKFPIYLDTYRGKKFYASFADVFVYEDRGDGTLAVKESKFSDDSRWWNYVPAPFTVPAMHDGKAVTKVDGMSRTGAETLVLSEGLKEIGNLSNSGFTHIEIPSTVETIGNTAFMNCAALEKITFAKNSKLKYIGFNAFDGSSIKEFSVQESMQIETISNCAFKNTGLTQFEIPATVTEIGTEAFSGENSRFDEATGKVTPFDITLASGSKLEKIGKDAFAGCVSSDFALPESLTDIGSLPKINGGAVITADDFVIRDGGASANDYVLIKYKKTTPRINIRKGAFSSMSKVDFEYAKGNVGLTGSFEKGWDDGLQVVYNVKERVKSGDSEFVIHRGSDPEATLCGFADEKKESLTVPETVNGATVTAVADYAFCDSDLSASFRGTLKKAVLPESITVIGKRAFDAVGLTDINMPSSLETVKSYAFDGSKIKFFAFDMPSIRTIESHALPESTAAMAVSKNLEILGAFGKNTSRYLKLYTDCDTVNGALPSGWEDTYKFDVTRVYGTITCKDNAVYSLTDEGGDREASLVHGKYADLSLTVPQKLLYGGAEYPVESIADSAFSFNRNFEESADRTVILPEGLKRIGKFAFYNAGLTEIGLPSTLAEIDSDPQNNAGAFSYCRFTEIELPAGITEIKDNMFAGCENLENITLASGHTGLTVFDRFAVDGTKITEYKGTAGEVVYCGDWCLGFVDLPSGSGDTTTIHLPSAPVIRSGTVNIASNAFAARETRIGSSFGTYGYIVGGLSGHAHGKVEIPNTVKYIGANAFYYQFIDEFYIPSSVEVIGAGFFGNGSVTVNCEASSKPAGWEGDWTSTGNITVNWGVAI